MTNNKKSKEKKERKMPVYRTKDQRKKEVGKLIYKLDALHLSTEYEAIKQFYTLMFQYISTGERIIINIPLPEMKKVIEGVLSININEPVAIRLKYNNS